jgi:hypothetical protein
MRVSCHGSVLYAWLIRETVRTGTPSGYLRHYHQVYIPWQESEQFELNLILQGCHTYFAPGAAFGLQRGPEGRNENVFNFFAVKINKRYIYPIYPSFVTVYL